MANERLTHSILILAVIFMVSCDNYVADLLDPRLPAYTEAGNNDAGCYINGEPWVDNQCYFDNECENYALIYDSLENKTQIVFGGELIESNQTITLYMELEEVRLTSYQDIRSIEGRRFIFGGNSPHRAYLSTIANPNTSCFEIIEQYGEFTVRSTGKAAEENAGDYFSGTFGYDLVSPCGEFQIYQGRFDFIFSAIHLRFGDF